MKSKLKLSLKACAITLILGLYFIYGCHTAVSENGAGDAFFGGGMLIMLVLMLSILLIPLFLLLAIFKKTRSFSGASLTVSLTIILTLFSCYRMGMSIRHDAFYDLADRSQKLITAIESFESKYGHLPESLDRLVPEYFVKVPQTGMAAYPDYEYYVDNEVKRFETDNPWILVIQTPSGGPNWDMFLYFPEQNYPETCCSGWLERVGDWAYLHE